MKKNSPFFVTYSPEFVFSSNKKIPSVKKHAQKSLKRKCFSHGKEKKRF